MTLPRKVRSATPMVKLQRTIGEKESKCQQMCGEEARRETTKQTRSNSLSAVPSIAWSGARGVDQYIAKNRQSGLSGPRTGVTVWANADRACGKQGITKAPEVLD